MTRDNRRILILAVVLVAAGGLYFLKPNLLSGSAENPMGPRALLRGSKAPEQAQPACSGSCSGEEGGTCAVGGESSRSVSGSGEETKAAARQEFGKPGAKLEIVAIIPVAGGSHKASESELKKAYQAHPKDIHLTIVDLEGSDGAARRGKGPVISISGGSEFTVKGRTVKLEGEEGKSYQPSDIVPIIEQELQKR